MNVTACKKCGLTIENKKPGTYYCENCSKDMKFFKVDAFCGGKPGELYDHDDDHKDGDHNVIH